MSFFRSETMSYYQLIIPRESAWYVLNELGKVNTVEIVDMNPEEAQMSRPYFPMIKRCDDILGKIQHFENEMLKYRIKNYKLRDFNDFLQNISKYSQAKDQPENRWFEQIEHLLDDKYDSLLDQLKNLENLEARQNQLFEYKAVLLRSKEVLGATYYSSGINVAIDPQVGQQASKSLFESKAFQLNYMVGVIDRDDAIRFKRMVFRVSKGNCWIVMSDIEYNKRESQYDYDGKNIPKEETKNPRTVFIIVYQGGSNEYLKVKLNRICDSFGAAKFTLPDDPSQIMNKVIEKDRQLDENISLLNMTKNKIKEILLVYADVEQTVGCSLLEIYRLLVLKDKAIYHNLNCLHLKNSIYGGFFWAPKAKENEISQVLSDLIKKEQNIPPAQFLELEPDENMIVPTHFKINEFTWAFQEIVNTYGIPRYKEINPGLFAVLFFPFMFGIMFGDIGHGGVLLTISILLVLKSDSLRKNPDNESLVIARYLFLLMGMCAFYCGFIYNDFMSMPFNLFGSCYEEQEHTLEAKRKENCIYPFGLDPVWYISSNELMYFNSFKMKFAVIYGVTQMLFGVILKGLNAIYFRSAVDFLCEFVPQILFMFCTFGYMIIMIIIKWNINWAEYGVDQAPSIITIMINIALKSGDTEGKPLWTAEIQESISQTFLMIAMICVPWMLIPKPFILKWQNEQKTKKHEPKKSLEPKELNEMGEPLLQSKISNTANKKAEELRRSLLRKQQEKELQLKKIQSKQEDAEKQQLLDIQVEGEQEETKDEKPQQIFFVVHQSGSGSGHGHGEFEFSEAFVHQGIESIEFVLNSISNTASYLRLWALSLAHGQLAKVFFEQCLGGGIISGNAIVIFLGWPVFLHCTVGGIEEYFMIQKVLMVMDLMECFLHALRLQWVEFQSKFYKADGVKFNPLSFKEIMRVSSIEQ